ncbi:MAG: hypothetical protein FJ388_14075, partial [Verrucomicrobia bacterium]|nr:hypothetical protein [Verrucomicrobiota bacterium]
PPPAASAIEPVTRIIGRSRAMVEVYNAVGRAAMSDSPVLILGEMGVGKELVAQEIHKYSARSTGQFTTLNCAAMAAEDFERDLLRIATHDPRSDAAAPPTPCTLLLKHVNELPPVVQQRLARIIDRRPTGAGRETVHRYRDIRYIASVTGGPEQADAMRRELFYALSVIQIMVPPLSKRLDDLPALVEHLLRKIELRAKKNLSVSPGAMKLLREHPWQGNVRELANALEKAAVMSPRTELREEEFQHLMAARLDPARVMRPIAEVEREHILSVFAQCGGDLARSAEVLGMSQSDIKRKLNVFASAAGGRLSDSSSACAACGHIYTAQEAARCNHKCPRCAGVEGAILVPTHAGDRGLPSDVPKFKSNRYVLYKLIDRSEFSEVWAGWQPSLCRRVVIKFLTAQDPNLLERFKREARIQATLRHPHIPAVYEAGTDELRPDQMFLAIEFIEGAALDQHSKDLLAKGNEKDRIREVLTLGRQIALALDYLHTQGLVHRDLKPQNIIATRNQCAYLIDYGITRSFHSEERLTSEGYILGTVPFMAPEQFTGDVKGLDGRTDVWGLGATLYYVLTGHLPFPGTKFEEVAQLIASAPPQSPRQVNPELNEETEQMLLRALEKSPHLRYARASDMAAAVQAAMDRY